ncbi:MAG: hypothetical protein U9Q88_13230 [Bacillota bacterium]|nr:hypothetical protein [Bacillota bacterium]
MKKWIIQALTKLTNSLTKLQTKLATRENKPKSLFEDLTPSTDIDENGKYAEAISWGLENDNVKNIALTGPYGSGKSSVLKTYEKKYRNTYHFLNISLATFRPQEGKNEEDDLEKSILQQMIYRVKVRTIPFSRFKRIKHVKNRSIIFYLTLLVASVTASIYLFQPTYLKDNFQGTLLQQNFTSGQPLNILWTFFQIAVTLLFPFVFLKNIYSLIRGNLNFNKVTIANATIEKNNVDAQSIFDKYLDEILYFFEATKYDVVIFEDLDRFDNLVIFERLRELNALINNSEQIKRRVVFIYAVKDEIFGVVDKDSSRMQDTIDFSKNRTKFFDFIIPVIPIINSSNSIDKLTKKIDKLTYADKIDRSFLNDVTIYIDDMRILKNVFNEFIIYKDKLGGIDLDLNKLLAMVIYKNIYPFDFSQLQYKKGLVYDVLQNKSAIIRTRTHTVETEIETLEVKIKGTEQETLTSLKELQVSYLDELGIYKPSQSHHNYYISFGGTTYYSNSESNAQNFFDNLKKTDIVNYFLPKYGRKQTEKAEQIATVFGTKQNYFEREEYIKIREGDRIECIKEELAELKQKKAEVSSKSLKELIEESDPQDVFSDGINNKKLLIYLLRHGYIDEMYNHYLTYFHPGSLTEADMKFIFSVKNHEPLEAHHPLFNIDKIIERLNGNEFKQEEILNYYLLNHLMENSHRETYQTYYDTIITQLANEKKESIDFIDGFRRIATHKNRFIQSICRKWDNIWHFIEKESNFSSEEKDSYVSDILAFANIDDIIKINKGEELSDFIARHHDFLTIAPTDKNKRMQILLELDVKFLALEKLSSDQELINNVVEKELYKINPSSLSTILGVATEQLSYSFIKQADRQDVQNYIDSNIEIYVHQVLLKVAIKEETEQALIDLLNRKDVSMNLKEEVIVEQPVVITDITKINHAVWPVLVSVKKIKITWSNVVAYFQEGESLDGDLVDFLNNPEVASELSKHYLGDEKKFDIDTVEKVSEAIIKNQEITEESFEVLTSSISKFSNFPVDSIPMKRVETMIIKGVLKLSNENFQSLKANYNNLICLYLEENIAQFIENMDNYPLEHDSVVQLFHSERVPEKYKIYLIEGLDVAGLSKEDTAFFEELADFILENHVQVSKEVFDLLIAIDMRVDNKLFLISKRIEEFDFVTITELLTKLGDPYAEIAENGKRPQIRNNEVHRKFVQALEDKHYISSSRVNGRNIRINTRFKMEEV